jgi:hypothetical protein
MAVSHGQILSLTGENVRINNLNQRNNFAKHFMRTSVYILHKNKNNQYKFELKVI